MSMKYNPRGFMLLCLTYFSLLTGVTSLYFIANSGKNSFSNNTTGISDDYATTSDSTSLEADSSALLFNDFDF